jgi:purine-binding chemotaxis protein CheW
MSMTASSIGTEPVRGTQCLTIRFGGEVYGIEVLRVREIIGLLRITRVPAMPDYVRGVVNLRGRIIPVVDLRVRFGIDVTEDGDRTCIVIVQVERDASPVTMGVIVESVADVVSLPDDAIEDVPSFGAGVDAAFLKGMGKLGDDVVMLLDIDSVLSADELDAVRELA